MSPHRNKTMLCPRLGVVQAENLALLATTYDIPKTALFARAVMRFVSAKRSEQRRELERVAGSTEKLMQVCLYMPPAQLAKARKCAADLGVPLSHLFRAALNPKDLLREAKVTP